jgi:ribosome-binding factor A
MKTHRLARVAEAIREVASETILFELRDPRVKRVTVTRAEVSGDLQHAKVYVSIMGTEKEQTLTMHGLRHAAGFIQSKLAQRLQTRFTPVISFVLDEGVKKSIEITRLINEALGPRAEQTDETPTADPAVPPSEPPDGSAAHDSARP